MGTDLVMSFRSSGYLAFHLRLYQRNYCGKWTNQIQSLIPSTILRLASPACVKRITNGQKIGEKMSSLYLERLGEKLLNSSLASGFFYPVRYIDEYKSNIPHFYTRDYEFLLDSQSFLTISENPFEIIYFRNELMMNQLLFPKDVQLCMTRISRISFENKMKTTEVKEGYVQNYSSKSYFMAYQDEDQIFFIQFDLSGTPVFIYAP